MPDLVRKSFQVTPEQSEALRVLAFQTRMSESEIVRLALAEYLNKSKEAK